MIEGNMQTNEPAGSKPIPDKTPADSASRPAWYQDALARWTCTSRRASRASSGFPGHRCRFAVWTSPRSGWLCSNSQAEMGKTLRTARTIISAASTPIWPASMTPAAPQSSLPAFAPRDHDAGQRDRDLVYRDGPSRVGSVRSWLRRTQITATRTTPGVRIGAHLCAPLCPVRAPRVVSDEDDDGNLAAGHGSRGGDDRGPPPRRAGPPPRRIAPASSGRPSPRIGVHLRLSTSKTRSLPGRAAAAVRRPRPWLACWRRCRQPSPAKALPRLRA